MIETVAKSVSNSSEKSYLTASEYESMEEFKELDDATGDQALPSPAKTEVK